MLDYLILSKINNTTQHNMATEHVLTIKDTLDILEKYDHPDYLKYTIELLDSLKFDRSTPFKEYLDLVKTEPEQWISKFPTSLKCSTSLCKPKTAMLNLLKKQRVIGALGADYCQGVSKKVSSAWKAMGKQEVERRLGINPQTVAEMRAGDTGCARVTPVEPNEEHDEDDECSDDGEMESDGEFVPSVDEHLVDAKAGYSRMQNVIRDLNNNNKRQQQVITHMGAEMKKEVEKVVLLKTALTDIIEQYKVLLNKL
jgi:hypothetical protein